jgi:hypothetical protein
MQLAYRMVRVDWASQAGLDLTDALLDALGWGLIKYGRDDFDQGYVPLSFLSPDNTF